MTKSSLPVVQTVGLNKVFKDFWRRPRVSAVQDLNIEIKPGEVFGLLGPNGSGKSTAIKMLLGLLYPTRGRISIFGRPPTDVAIKQRIGYLPEESYLYRFLDARETLDFYGRLFRQHGQVRRERRDMLLEMVGLQHESKRRIGEYSKGMARRIGLAQALINDPEFLVLDEPTSGLDPIGTRQIKDVIRRLGDMGKTILLSSHLLADVEDVCDRVCILYGGKVQAEGTIKELLAQKDVTQIRADKLRPDTIEEIKSVVQRRESKPIDVSVPTGRLENLFLKIVEDAQAAKIATSGAGQAGAIPEFLGTATDDGGAIIQSLIKAADKDVKTEPVPMAVEKKQPPKPSQKVIDDLTKPKSSPQSPSETAQVAPKPLPSSSPAKPVQADRSVIDGLLGQEDSVDQKDRGDG
ncbi:MAG: ABC transporter ATP-binding protein [Phycisphaerae bacterium]|nr:MAG: ABC transporter ATP-binding protein [Phycisphaerae bacterium]